MEELSVEKEIIKEISKCMDLLVELFESNNISHPIATNAMLSLTTTIFIADKVPYEHFVGLLLRTIEEARKRWKEDE